MNPENGVQSGLMETYLWPITGSPFDGALWGGGGGWLLSGGGGGRSGSGSSGGGGLLYDFCCRHSVRGS